MALEDAGIPEGALAGELGVILATSFGPSSFTEGLLEQILQQGPHAASPFLFTESVANAPAAQIALAFRARGANLTVTQREAGPLLALARGTAEVARGRMGCALVLAVDEVTSLLHGILHRFGALTTANGGTTPRPFDRRRDGYLVAESAAVAVVEPAVEAQRRGAQVLARVGAVVRGFDPGASRTGWGNDPTPLATTLSRGLELAGLRPADFDRIVSGAAGTSAGDLLEARVLLKVWGETPLPPVIVPKAVTGEHGGGFLASALLIAGGASVGAPSGFGEVDPDFSIVPYDGFPLPPPQRILATSLAPGGAAVWVVLEAP
jgi:3-oxoacyl-[acyl-carrier-protein] synthase II